MKIMLKKLIIVLVMIISYEVDSKPMYSVATENTEFDFLQETNIEPSVQKSALLFNSILKNAYAGQNVRGVKINAYPQKIGFDPKRDQTATWIFRLFTLVMAVYLLKFCSPLDSE